MSSDIRKNLEVLNYAPHYADLSNFLLVAECKNGNVEFFPYEHIKKERDIYVIQMGEDMYVGCSGNMKLRCIKHLKDLQAGIHVSKKMQELYIISPNFKMYRVMRCNCRWAEAAENLVIRLLNPSLNTAVPYAQGKIQDTLLWSYSTEYDRVNEKLQEEIETEQHIICPSCRRELKINIVEVTKKKPLCVK